MTTNELALRAVELLSPVLLALLSYLAVRATQWFKAKTDNALVGFMLDRVSVAVLESVKEVNATIVAAIREASSDGVITDEEAADIKQDAIDAVKAYLGEKGLKQAKTVLGSDALDAMITTKIEAYVHDMKL